MASPNSQSGLTPASLAAMFFGLLLTAILVQYFEVVVMIAFPAEHALALPAIWAFLAIAAVASFGKLATKITWLNKAELLCVLFVMLMAAPLMTQAFWHRIVAVTATNPRLADLDKLAATNDQLWPHGPDVLADKLKPDSASLQIIGPGSANWNEFDLGQNRKTRGVTLENKGPGETFVRIKIPAVAEGQGPTTHDSPAVTLGSPCLISVLHRATGLAPDAAVFIRLAGEGTGTQTDVARSVAAPKITFQDPTGFGRVGAYNVKFPVGIKGEAWFEVGLAGVGKLELANAQLMDVGTLESVFRGRREVTRAQWDALPVEERAGLLVRPDSLASWSGVQYLVAGYVPWRDWWRPLTVWGLFVLIVLGACLSINLLFRRQWIDNERNLLPVAQIPAALSGVTFEEADAGQKPWYQHKVAWFGFSIGLFWLLARAAHTYDPRVPDLTVKVVAKEYLSNPAWGTTWEHTYLTMHPCLIALCGFMELSVLVSLIVGFFAYRSQGFVGARMGWNSNPNYPFEYQQQLASFLAYAVGILWIARRHLARVGKALFKGQPEGDRDEPVTYRTSVLMLMACVVGGLLWAWWLGISVGGFAVFLGMLLAIGLVSSKIRAEFGTPWGYLAPSNFALLLLLLGGVTAFGPEAVLFCYIASFMLSPTVFFLIPGAQLELLELGKRAQIRAWHLPAVCVLAVVGGMVFGAWTFLSNGYALGGETFRYTWAFDAKPWYFFSYNQELTRATNAMTGNAAQTGGSWFTPERWAYLYSGGMTLVLVACRQLWRGFFLHPAGFVLGMTGMAAYAWGSALTALIIRATVVYFGGAVAVRRSLTPFLIGLFVGGAMAELFIGVDAAFRRAAGSETVFGSIFPP